MYAKQQAVQEAVTALKKAIGKSFTVTPDMIDAPPSKEMGDLAFPCFELAKGQNRNPAELATELAAKIGPNNFIEKAQAAGPYVNFYLADTPFSEQVLKEISVAKEKYGHSTSGEGKSVLIDYANPNTHKEFHVGHVRNVVFGQSIVNVLRANGYKVIPASYIGDSGADVGKAVWGFEKFVGDTGIAEEMRVRKMTDAYAQASAYVEEHPEAKEEIAEVTRAIEEGEDPWFKLWKTTRQWSIDAFKEIFAELNVAPEVWYFESELEAPGKALVKKMLTDGIAEKSEGATVVNLEDEDLGVFLVLKSDGSALYSTWDLALAYRKEEEFHPDRQIFVVDVRQSLHFKQLFATLKRMGFSEQMVHIPYDFVKLPEGAMSSRKGNVVTYGALKEKMTDALKKETAKRREEWDEKKVQDVAHKLAIASIQFTMLRQDPETQITFDIEEALSFEGFTAPYILYTIARIASIKRQTKVKPKADASKLTHENERALIRQLADFPEAVQRAGKSFQVSAIAAWAFETAKLFAEYYHQVRILDEKEAEFTPARLALCDAVKSSLENAMSLLGIETLEEM